MIEIKSSHIRALIKPVNGGGLNENWHWHIFYCGAERYDGYAPTLHEAVKKAQGALGRIGQKAAAELSRSLEIEALKEAGK